MSVQLFLFAFSLVVFAQEDGFKELARALAEANDIVLTEQQNAYLDSYRSCEVQPPADCFLAPRICSEGFINRLLSGTPPGNDLTNCAATRFVPCFFSLYCAFARHSIDFITFMLIFVHIFCILNRFCNEKRIFLRVVLRRNSPSQRSGRETWQTRCFHSILVEL